MELEMGGSVRPRVVRRIASWAGYYRWILIGAFIGIASGVSAYIFFVMLSTVSMIVLEISGVESTVEGDVGVALAIGGQTPLILVISMVTGAALSSIVVYRLAPEAEGGGTNAVVNLFHRRAAIIPIRSGYVKAVASSLVVGTGGSGGIEGPSVMIGGSVGSAIASRLGLALEDRRIAVISGMAAALSMIFHAPLGSAMFSVEVLYKRDVEASAFIPALIASVTSYLASTRILMYGPPLPQLDVDTTILYTPQYYLGFAILGLAIAPFAVLFTYMFRASQRLFSYLESRGLKREFKPVLGALGAGAIILAAPFAAGSGRGVLELVLSGVDILGSEYGSGFAATAVLASAAVLKMAATSLSVGSGGSGGLFAPSLLSGALLGMAFYEAVLENVPWLVAGGRELYAYLGMSAFFAAAAKVPIATSIMVAEMGSSYLVILPALLSSVIAREFSGGPSLYSGQLDHRPPREILSVEGILEAARRLGRGSEVRLRDVANMYYRAARLGEGVARVIEIMVKHRQIVVPIVDKDGTFLGVVELDDLEKLVEKGLLGRMADMGELPLRSAPALHEYETVEDAIDSMLEHEKSYVVVVDGKGRYVGLVMVQDVLSVVVHEVSDLVAK